ncbi:chorismate synthase [Campylobacter sp. 19-13652]|uniref:chorismate synthase n=1 Tax=Campylobacter sp. 19-13652 TaxID=2840180 RepID=UPI001C76875C|nr:chorismate synthase [Campylobacter sp. 19-13652]BCX78782.1 chorismate synthase [Campylobacter sp. 19-13652]
MNSFGNKFRLTTFGESHGVAIGGVIDGMPSGVKIDLELVQSEINRRRGGQSVYATPRAEADRIEVFSGIFEGFSTGTPIGFAIYNENQKSKDYESLRDIFRAGHADWGYYQKYAVRDHRGGGRASARETAVRVAGGAFARLLLDSFGVSVKSGVLSVGSVDISGEPDWDLAARSEIFALGAEEAMKAEIMNARNAHDSVGASVLTIAQGVMAGLGEPLYGRLDAALASALMGINGVKAVEIGEGVRASRLRGSENNDNMGENGFLSNHSGGILGGISSGEPIVLKSHFKPTPSIFKPQMTLDKTGAVREYELRGRHDPCIGVRGSVVATAMVRLVLADMLLLNASSKLESLQKLY